MQLLLFEIGNLCYGLDFSLINEVIPIVEIRKIPNVPDYISGVINYRDIITPVIDLCFLLTGIEAKKLFSTRIIIINYVKPGEDINKSHLLGLIAEHVTETVVCRSDEIQSSGISDERINYLGDFAKTNNRTIQQILPGQILPEELHKMLFNRKEEK